ncbi:hypothetical protein PIB30_062412 [Stylosanthes scabra]|uniref:Uncharacterized protein n=1 Tax=Stylosanthes scabra TaxID=79078 RepID=A0ABU6TNH8_9FABA|nr:hypothetical protein [Stylosanthes scabra]
MSQPAVKKPIFIDLTKDSESERRSKEENPEKKLANTLQEDDVLRNDPGFWTYDDLDDWGTAEPAASSEASCTSHPPPNH